MSRGCYASAVGWRKLPRHMPEGVIVLVLGDRRAMAYKTIIVCRLFVAGVGRGHRCAACLKKPRCVPHTGAMLYKNVEVASILRVVFFFLPWLKLLPLMGLHITVLFYFIWNAC